MVSMESEKFPCGLAFATLPACWGWVPPKLSVCTNPRFKWNALILYLFQLCEQFSGLLCDSLLWLFCQICSIDSSFQLVDSMPEAFCETYYNISVWCIQRKQKSNKYTLHACTLGVTARNWHSLLAREISHMCRKIGVTSQPRDFAHTTLTLAGKK